MLLVPEIVVEPEKKQTRVQRRPDGGIELVVFKTKGYDHEKIVAVIDLRSVAEWIKANAPELLR